VTQHEARAEEPKPLHPRPGRVAAAQPAPAKVAEKVVEKPAPHLAKAEPIAKPAHLAKAEPAAKPAPIKTAAIEPAKPVKAKPVVVAEAPKPIEKPARATEPVKVASIAPAKPVPAEPVKVAAAPAPAPVAPASKEPEATGALSPAPAAPSAEFRWPARGRVISGFGGSGSNEGINIAVPEGTPVKAAESGTVAYAGSEVKGYGNLVLIRHDNGFVSAYAHNGDIEVKRGQRVTRGQEIAKSGQTGNVTSPQLHFELRKGSTPVDPTPHLASN
jgi:murein DD-endopeptidase MepM/ murein hydrolase activator NlpD